MRPDIAIASSAARPEWLTRRERGSLVLLRAMAVVSRAFGRTPTRVILYLVAAYFVFFAPTAKRDSRNYLRRALGRCAIASTNSLSQSKATRKCAR